MAKYTGARYTQHSTGVRDGRDGFIEFFEPFIERNPVRDIQVIRALEDGRYVFVHVYQSLSDGESEWVTTDFFDTDDEDRIVEHWDVIAPFGATTPSGHTAVDGPTEGTDFGRTVANKTVALAAERPLVYDEVVLLVGQGNFVATLCRTRRDGAPFAQVDPFRLEDGLIVEHWPNAEPVPPRDEWVNSGKF